MTEVEIPFEPTVRVRGRVQTKDGQEPVVGGLVSVGYGAFRQSESVRTDVEGRFEVNALTGEVRQQLIMKPDNYSDWVVEKAGWQNPVKVPTGKDSFDLPPLELIETTLYSGSLVDHQNRPIAGARISAITGNRVYAGARTQEDGTFELRLPQELKIERYRIHRTRGAPPAYATVISDSPLKLRADD